jgi:hypothetical protein
MRDFKGMKRQRNRGRGGGGGNTGGKPQQHNANRAFDSNGPDNVKVRGAAQHIYEKYQQLARDAGSAGDRVLAENYLQHAEHYFRVLRAMQPQRPISEIIGRDQFVSGYDIDFEDESQNVEEPAESEPEAAAGEGRQDRQWQPREDRQQNDRPREDRQQQGEYRARDDRPREDRQQGEYRQPRDDRPQGEYRQQRDERPQGEYRQRDDREFRPREDRQQGEFRPREDRFRDQPRDQQRDQPRERFQRDRPQGERQNGERPNGERPNGERANDRGDRPPRQDREYRQDRAERDPLGVIEPQATPLVAPAAAPAPAYEPPAVVLRGEDGAMSHAPAFLQPRAAAPAPEAEEAAAETRRPRRRRAPRSFEAGDAPAPAEAEEG